MKEKELDNTYMSEVGDGQKRLSTDPVEVDNGLDAIIVSNVTQTLSGGTTIVANPQGFLGGTIYPAGTPVIKVEGFCMPATICLYEGGSGYDPFLGFGEETESARMGIYDIDVVGVLVRTHNFANGNLEADGVAMSAHINAEAYANAVRSISEEAAGFTSDAYLTNGQREYIPVMDWFNSPAVSLTIENAETTRL